jgi:pimeloyl-ACP methyl ester carboxylesterase
VVALEAPAHPGDPAALARAIGALGIDAFDLMGTSATAAAALELALHEPARVRSLVLEAPAALGGTEREARLERRLPDLAAPTLVLWGTADEAMPAAVRRVYAELIPGAHLVFVYAAARAIGADRPEAFAGVVADFLERREAFVISRAPTLIHP